MSSRPAIMVRDIFEILMDALQEKYDADWEKDSKKSGVSSPSPKYKILQEKRIFLGTKRNALDSSIYSFMKRHPIIEDLKFTARYLNDRLDEFKKLKKPEDTITFHNWPYNTIYFNYIGYDSFDDFLASDLFNSEKGKKLLELQSSINSKDKKRSKYEFTNFYFLGLRLSETRIVRHQMLIDFKQEKVRLISEDEKTYDDGSFVYRKGFIQISFDRLNATKEIWMPFSVYFQWNGSLDSFRGGVGTYSGVAYNKKRAIAGFSVLVRQEDYDKKKSPLPLSIDRYLFLENHGIDVIANHSFEDTLKVSDNDYAQLKKFIGTHEIFDLGRSKSEALASYKLVIKDSFLSILYSAIEEYQYMIRLQSDGDALLMNVFSKHSSKHPREVIFSNCCVISKNKPLYDDGTTLIYGGGVTGISRFRTAEHFPIILVINPPEPKARRYSLPQIAEVFLKDPKRKELNQIILEQLRRMESMRIQEVSDILKGLPITTQ